MSLSLKQPREAETIPGHGTNPCPLRPGVRAGGAAPAFQMERENSSGSLDCARQGAAPAEVTSGKSRAGKGIWGCCLFACGRSSGSCWRPGCTSMAVPAVLQQSHGLCLCWDGRLREAGWESCGSFCFSSERETHCAAGEAGRASPFPLH